MRLPLNVSLLPPRPHASPHFASNPPLHAVMSAGVPEADGVLAAAASRPPVGAPRLLFPDQNLLEIRRNIHLSNRLRSNLKF